MGDDLKAIVKAAVVLTVDQVLLPVGDAEDTLRVIGVFSAAIDLQLDTEETVSLPIEDGLGLIAILMNGAAVDLPAATLAVGVIVVIRVVTGVGMDERSAAGTVGVISVVAVRADGERIIFTAVSAAQKTRPAIGANKRQGIQANRAVKPPIELGKLGIGGAAVGTDTGLGCCHGDIPP